MNASIAARPTMPSSSAPGHAAPARRAPQARDFGTGYGRSSGYAATRSYTSDAGLARFRFG